MHTYGQFCPVAKASELIAERWTPLIVRELLAGSHRFNELQHGLPRISRALPNWLALSSYAPVQPASRVPARRRRSHAEVER